MRGAARLVLVLSILLVPVGAAQTCRMDYYGGSMEYPCGSGESPAAADEPESWTANLDIILGVLGILLTLGAGAYTYSRVRSRRRALTGTLSAIERAYVDAKGDPVSGIARLTELRAQVRAMHDKGKIDDGHFLELDKRATTYIVKLRILEVDRRFAHLPPLFLAEIRRLLGDGVLSSSEADLIEVRAAAYRIQDPARRDLIALTRAWANEDAPPELEPTAVAARGA